MRQCADMSPDDDRLYDLMTGMPDGYEPPQYPSGLMFSIPCADLEANGETVGDPGSEMRFSAMGEVTSTFHSVDDCRIELELTQFAGESGKFFDLTSPSHICLCGPELEKMDLDEDAERGDTIHLIGDACLVSKSSTEYAGDVATFQVVRLTFEDES